MSAKVSELLVASNLFQADFCSFVACELLAGRVVNRVGEENILPGVSLNEAIGVLNQRQRLVSAYFDNLGNIENYSKIGVKSVTLEPFRVCSKCPRAPKRKKKYEPDEVPVFPCLDCVEDMPCIVAYKLNY